MLIHQRINANEFLARAAREDGVVSHKLWFENMIVENDFQEDEKYYPFMGIYNEDDEPRFKLFANVFNRHDDSRLKW